jgi:lipid-binding SYLF domain-containing protein
MMRNLNLKRLALAGAFAVLAIGAARTVYADESDAQLVNDAKRTVATYKEKDPSIETFFRKSAAYTVFPGIGKGGLGIGGAHGNGVLFENGKPVGKVTMNQVTIGAQAGGQEFSQIVFYETPKAVAELKASKANFTGDLSAVALNAGAAANAHFKNGVAVFTATKGGLMLEASLGGQKFKYEAFPTL